MTREDALGLFGELWFLRRWVGIVTSTTVNGWQATNSTRHDFQWPSVSVEVKTTTTQSAGPPVHRIASLEQLADPEQGQLYLFSLQVCDDALASNTLHNLVASLSMELQRDFQALREFNDKLAARGYSPADQQAPARPFRILAERLNRVSPEFPKLTRYAFQPAGLPAGIVGLEYALDLSACGTFLLASSPTDAEAIRFARQIRE